MSDAPAKTFDWRNEESVSVAVIRAIAEFEGRDPTEMEPLHWAIDTDALNAIFPTTEVPDGHSRPVVTFGFEGYRIQVSWTGEGKLFENEPPQSGANDEVA